MSSQIEIINTNFDSLAKRVKFIRESTGLSQQKFADLIQTSQGTIRNFETGHTKNITKMSLVRHFETKLNVNPGWLLEGKGEIYTNSDLNNSLNTIDNSSLCSDNIKNNVSPGMVINKGSIENMAVSDQLNQLFVMFGRLEGQLNTKIEMLEKRNEQLEKEIMKLKYKKEEYDFNR